MSVAFNTNSEEFGADKWNLMPDDDRSHYRSRSRSSVWWIAVAALCLELLCLILLVVILSFVVQNDSDSHQPETQTPAGQFMCENLTHQWFQLQSRYNLLFESKNQLQAQYINVTVERNTLKTEREQVKADYDSLSRQMVALQNDYNSVVAHRNRLQEEVDLLSLNQTQKPCHLGWISYNLKCYYVSEKGQTKTWQNARKNCEDKGAHLAIITSQQEQDFVSSFYERTWIGLSDIEHEGKWKWVDGTDLTGMQMWQSGEPNDSDGNEDCVEVSRNGGGWNDLPCRFRFSWVCEL